MADNTVAGAGLPTAAAPSATTKKWFMRTMSKDKVLDFVNGAPVQVAGEVVVANRSDGSVDLYYFSTTH